MSDSASLSKAERRVELAVGCIFILLCLHAAALIFGVTLVAFVIVWLGLVLSLRPRRRRAFKFEQHLLIVLIVVGLVWIVFGFALGTGERSEDPTILPTRVSLGSSEATLDSQTTMFYGVLSVLGLGAAVDGFRHSYRRKRPQGSSRRRTKPAEKSPERPAAAESHAHIHGN
jgi:hypothetical protein